MELNKDILEDCAALLERKALSLAIAESATAGRIISEFALCENAGRFLLGGIVCYNASVKEQVLEVDTKMIETFTPESMEVTRAISLGLGKHIPADILIGVTGLLCAGGSETASKPVGTMFFSAFLGENLLFEDRTVFTGSPESIVLQSTNHLATILLMHLSS